MMMLSIETGNAAFCAENDSATENAQAERAECARILRYIADRLDDGQEDGACIDVNGNNVGRWSL